MTTAVAVVATVAIAVMAAAVAEDTVVVVAAMTAVVADVAGVATVETSMTVTVSAVVVAVAMTVVVADAVAVATVVTGMTAVVVTEADAAKPVRQVSRGGRRQATNVRGADLENKKLPVRMYFPALKVGPKRTGAPAILLCLSVCSR